ncbi:MAG: hypothetical protein DRI57_27075 [Deltaproteobacteria bacterium]|nr:MAG: hypothetical protein DRI57_27075 [Deltaproteobacteria bacterium]
MPEKKIFITDDNTVMFICPKCGKEKSENALYYKEIEKASRIKRKCECGHSYAVLLERRQFYRKKMNLPGICLFGEDEKQPMLVRNLSLTGLNFKLEKKQHFTIDDKIFVEFPINDTEKMLIRKLAIVKKITGLIIGAEFCTAFSESASDEAIKDYVIP